MPRYITSRPTRRSSRPHDEQLAGPATDSSDLGGKCDCAGRSWHAATDTNRTMIRTKLQHKAQHSGACMRERTRELQVTSRPWLRSSEPLRWMSLFHVVVALIGPLAFLNPALAQTWVQTVAPLGYWSSVASSADGSVVLAADGGFGGAGGSLYISSDSGATWAPANAPVVIWTSVASSADGSHLVATAYSDQIYTSTDGGVTWNGTTAPSAGWNACAVSADGTKLAAAVFGGMIYRSSDSGA